MSTTKFIVQSEKRTGQWDDVRAFDSLDEAIAACRRIQHGLADFVKYPFSRRTGNVRVVERRITETVPFALLAPRKEPVP